MLSSRGWGGSVVRFRAFLPGFGIVATAFSSILPGRFSRIWIAPFLLLRWRVRSYIRGLVAEGMDNRLLVLAAAIVIMVPIAHGCRRKGMRVADKMLVLSAEQWDDAARLECCSTTNVSGCGSDVVEDRNKCAALACGGWKPRGCLHAVAESGGGSWQRR